MFQIGIFCVRGLWIRMGIQIKAHLHVVDVQWRIVPIAILRELL